jgi:prevent-host-death family protein
MKQKTYSIAEARDQFAALIRQVEAGDNFVQVTRRGEPVAVILSMDEYERLLAHQPKRDFWQAYLEWREMWCVDEWEDDIDPFADVRDRSPGREVNVWE